MAVPKVFLSVAYFVASSKALADSHSTCSHWWSSLIEGTHGHLEPCALPNEHILLGHDDVFEGDAPCVAGPLSHVDLLPAGGDARGVGIHDEPCDGLAGWALRVGVGPRQHKVVVCNSAIGDPHFLTIDNPLISLLLCLGLHTTHVTSSARLGHTIGAHQRLLDQPAKVLLLLFMVASDHDRHRTEAICLNGSHDTRATVGHLLSDQTNRPKCQ